MIDKKIINLLLISIVILTLNVVAFSIKFKRDYQMQELAKKDRKELLDLNRKQLQILEKK